ncbi:hypothetical protein [Streptomyces sp. NPDC086519]|uniref:hypothetical protein n=1 Tax=Streptomyces sp. NPDC086519 TaxID=3154863 RepID=UPI003419D033
MKVIRVLPETGWTGVDNLAARNRRISFRAKGLLLELLSYPPDNSITIAKLAGWSADARKNGFVAEGREALQMAMRELEREGYVVHVKRRTPGGQWETTTFVSAVPEALSEVAPSTGLPRSADQSSADQSSVDQYTADQRSSTWKTDGKTGSKTGEEDAGLQSSSALAAARAGEDAHAASTREVTEAVCATPDEVSVKIPGGLFEPAQHYFLNHTLPPSHSLDWRGPAERNDH